MKDIQPNNQRQPYHSGAWDRVGRKGGEATTGEHFLFSRTTALETGGDTVERSGTSRRNRQSTVCWDCPKAWERGLSSAIRSKTGKFNRYVELRETGDLLDVEHEQGGLDNSQVSGLGDNVDCGMVELETVNTKAGLRGQRTIWKSAVQKMSSSVLHGPPDSSCNTVLRCHSRRGT